MKTYDIRQLPDVRLSGRFDPAQDGFPMMWTGACADMLVLGGTLEVLIRCNYETFKPYLSFEVDGLMAQTFSPIRGEHWYSVFLGMDATKPHRVRIILETQAFPADPTSNVALLTLQTDGTFLPLPAPARRVEFIGDSITSGEGMRGPASFMEWLPMCFSATNNYTRYAAQRMDAAYQVVSQSGWGVLCGWNNDVRTVLPAVYDWICRPAAMESPDGTAHGGEKPYAFDFDPDTVVVNLGSNDFNALSAPPFTDPVTGETHQLTKADLPRFEEACLAFLLHLHEKNPRARLIWAYGVCGDELAVPITAAVRRAKAAGIDAVYVALPHMDTLPDGLGSREHPGTGAAKVMAELIAAAAEA